MTWLLAEIGKNNFFMLESHPTVRGPWQWDPEIIQRDQITCLKEQSPCNHNHENVLNVLKMFIYLIEWNKAQNTSGLCQD